MMIFDPRNWYWIVGGSITQVYSSALGDYIPVTNVTYQAWLTQGNLPTKIDTEANLGDALSQYLLRPIASGVLDGFKSSLASGIALAANFRVDFNQENRIRAIERTLGLNGSPPDLTPAQAIAAIKALM